jgi:hypothetical protein
MEPTFLGFRLLGRLSKPVASEAFIARRAFLAYAIDRLMPDRGPGRTVTFS